MDRDPHGVDGFHECTLFFVGDDRCCMPSGAAIQHVEDNVFVHEEKIALHLLVESVWNVYTASVARAGLCPGAAHAASVDNFWNKVEDSLGDSDSLKEPSHGMV